MKKGMFEQRHAFKLISELRSQLSVASLLVRLFCVAIVVVIGHGLRFIFDSFAFPVFSAINKSLFLKKI